METNENIQILEQQPQQEIVEETLPQEPQQEEPPKLYTDAELNARVDELLEKKVGRREARIRKEYEQKYGSLTDVLRAGTGEEDVGKIADSLREFYKGQGVTVPDRAAYSEEDVRVLAKAEAEDIIASGDDEVAEELDRLAGKGVKNMTPREKAVFQTLAQHRQTADRDRELSQLGVTKDVYESKAFKDFADKFSPSTPVREVYDIYAKLQPKKEITTMGSMQNHTAEDGGVKDFYTRDEALKFTKKDFDKNPALFKAVEASMLKW